MATFLKTWPLGCENSQGKLTYKSKSLEKKQRKFHEEVAGIYVLSMYTTQYYYKLATTLSWEDEKSSKHSPKVKQTTKEKICIDHVLFF